MKFSESDSTQGQGLADLSNRNRTLPSKVLEFHFRSSTVNPAEE
jgi:hypothetical protein